MGFFESVTESLNQCFMKVELEYNKEKKMDIVSMMRELYLYLHIL